MAPLPGMLRWNTDTNVFERSVNEGSTWTPLVLSGVAAATDHDVIFNDAGVYNGDSGLSFDKYTQRFTVTGTISANIIEVADLLAYNISIDGGLHVGGTSAAGDNNLLVDGTITAAGNVDITKASPKLTLQRSATTEYGVIAFKTGASGTWDLYHANTATPDFLLYSYGLGASTMVVNYTTGKTSFLGMDINGGLHVGGTSDAGDNNLLVDGNVSIGTTILTRTLLLSAATNAGGLGPNIGLYSTHTHADSRNWVIANTWDNVGDLTFRVSNAKDGDPMGATGTSRFVMLRNGNIGFNITGFGSSAVGVIGIANGTAPSSSPAGMGQVWVESGALKYRGSSGTVTTLGVA